MKKTLIIGFLLSSIGLTCLAEGDSSIVEAITTSDPDALRSVLIPGFYIQKDKKAEYLELARKVTNETYVNLNKGSWSDGVRFFKGLGEVAAGAALGFCAFGFYRGSMGLYASSPQVIVQQEGAGDVPTPIEQGWSSKNYGFIWGTENGSGTPPANLIANEKVRNGLSGSLAMLALYLASKGFAQWRAISHAKSRKDHHKRAFAVEAIIQRLPVCTDTLCDQVVQ